MDFYLALAGDVPGEILDLGCGTGRLACALAQRGPMVTGADPAAAMLDIARRRAGADKVTWIEADAAGLPARNRFDLVIMTGHVFQVFLEDADVMATLRAVHRHLGPGGRIAFETRNPHQGEWRKWTRENTGVRLDVPGAGVVQVHYEVVGQHGQQVTCRDTFSFFRQRHFGCPQHDPLHRKRPAW
ncbi:MAG: class I SAM-dependent methyltransferase [Alphaproteobacteria bacterium]